MSLIVAEIKDGAVYFCADTQTSEEIGKLNNTNESALKVCRMPHGIIIGTAGEVRTSRRLICHKDWFEELGEQKLTKEFLVMRVLPKLYTELDSLNYIKEKSPAYMSSRFLIAQEDRLFLVENDFSVYTVPTGAGIGCGVNAWHVAQQRLRHLPLREKMLEAMRLASRLDNTIGAPYVLIDTKHLEFEFVEE